MLTSTSVRRPTLYLHLRLPTQGPTLTLSNAGHKTTTPQYWTETVKELCDYISQSERPTITNCRTRPVPNGPTKAIRSSGGIALYGTMVEQVDRVEPHPPLLSTFFSTFLSTF